MHHDRRSARMRAARRAGARARRRHRAGRRCVVVFCALRARISRRPRNLANILVQSTILLLLALPMTLIIMTEGLDLSMGAVLTFASIVLALTTLATGSAALGLAGGARDRARLRPRSTASLVACLDIPPFVATLGTLGVAQGLCARRHRRAERRRHPAQHPGRLFGRRARHPGADRSSPRSPIALFHRAALPHAVRHLHLRARRQPRGAAARRRVRPR